MVRGNVARIRSMTLDPDELCLAAFALPLLELVPNGLDEVLVFDGTLARLPPVFLPVYVPFCHALDRIFAVGADLQILGDVDGLEGAEDGREFCPLVRLNFAFESL